MARLVVKYEHDPADHAPIFLGVLPVEAAGEHAAMKPAFRDTIDGERVVWIDTELTGWVRAYLADPKGVKALGRVNIGA